MRGGVQIHLDEGVEPEYGDEDIVEEDYGDEEYVDEVAEDYGGEEVYEEEYQMEPSPHDGYGEEY
jgi:hypothetical protein